MLKRSIIVLLALSLWACPRRPVESTAEPPLAYPDIPGPASANRKVDVLFVVDNSTSMASEQVRLGDNLSTLVTALGRLEGGFPDAHIGVVSTDVGTGPWAVSGCSRDHAGRLRHEGAPGTGCSPPGDPYIEIENANGLLSGNIANVDTPTANGLGCQGLQSEAGPVPAKGDTAIDGCDIQAAFRCIALLGDDGCNYEQPLEAARLALTCDEDSCTNPGFLRPDALLAVVFLGDQDDCSARDPALFDPADAQLGPPNFRCFEHGMSCDQTIDRETGQTLTGCHSNEESDYLFPVQDYQEFFATLRPDGRVVLAAIGGPYAPGDSIHTGRAIVEPSCLGPGAEDRAEPAVRIHELVRSFGENGIVLADLSAVGTPDGGGGICTDDFGPALDRLGEIIVDEFRQRCIPGELVVETEDGLAPIDHAQDALCVVTEVTSGEEGETRVPLEACAFASDVADACVAADRSPGRLAGDSPRPCWYVCDAGTTGEEACPYGWELRVCRDPACDLTTPAPQDAATLALCLTGSPGPP